ncbi:MAG: 30S ribosomal protein S17 [Nanoarchaeota archaeon]
MTKKETEVQKDSAKKKLVGTRGRVFYGNVVKKFENRAVVEFERTVKVHKYERFMRKKTRLHSRIPAGVEVNVGDYVKVQECRPLSKLVHSVVVEVVRKVNAEDKK